MSKKRGFIPSSLAPWIEARQRFRLSHAHVQMARELGMNPKTFGKLANHDQERWKAPLPGFIARLYAERFGKSQPEIVRTVEEIASAELAKRQARRARKASAALCGQPTGPHAGEAADATAAPTGPSAT